MTTTLFRSLRSAESKKAAWFVSWPASYLPSARETESYPNSLFGIRSEELCNILIAVINFVQSHEPPTFRRKP